jgi:hypothetical protein
MTGCGPEVNLRWVKLLCNPGEGLSNLFQAS